MYIAYKIGDLSFTWFSRKCFETLIGRKTILAVSHVKIDHKIGALSVGCKIQ
jgi:hypothetical protein